MLGWTPKAYNRIFLSLIKRLRDAEPPAAALRRALSDSSGESTEWPTDAKFLEAWLARPLYDDLGYARVVHILRRLSETYLTRHNEDITIESPLTIEHILPQDWLAHWPLPDGQTGLTHEERWDTAPDDSRATASNRRDSLKHTMGNLTILTQALNSSVSNAAWNEKRDGLLSASLLPINQQLHTYAAWDESAIEKRGRDLFTRGLKLWPGPDGAAHSA